MRLLCFATLLLSAPSAFAAKPKIAVLDVSTTGMEASLAPLLTEVLTVEVDALGRYQVVAGSDIRSMLGFEKQKDLFGCNEAACLAEIGGALGVEKIVVSNIGRLGGTYVVNIKLIDIAKVETQGRVYETVQGEVDRLLETIRSGVRRLFASVADGRPAAPTATVVETRPAAPPAVAQTQPERPAVKEPAPERRAVKEPPPARPIAPPVEPRTSVSSSSGRSWVAPIALWSVGAVALGAGAYFGTAAKQSYDRATDVDLFGRQVEIGSGERNQLVANIAFGVSAVALASGLGVWWLGGPAPATVAVAPTDGGVALVSSFALDL